MMSIIEMLSKSVDDWLLGTSLLEFASDCSFILLEQETIRKNKKKRLHCFEDILFRLTAKAFAKAWN